MTYKTEFFGQIDGFLPDFLWKSGQRGLSMAESSLLGSNINSLLEYEHFLFMVLKSQVNNKPECQI